MKFYLKAYVTTLLVCFSFCVSAQSLPSASPKSVLTQRLGVSDITLTYSRPGVKGRTIFGELIPYGKIWRTGADYPTFIELTDTTFFGVEKDTVLPGKYALYTIPGKEKWTIILSAKTTLWGAYGYTPEDDVLRFEVTSFSTSKPVETLTIDFDNMTSSSCEISIRWENTEVSFPVTVDIYAEVVKAMAQLDGVKDNKKRGYYAYGARFLLEVRRDPERALSWIDSALKDGHFYSDLWTKAQILAWMGRYQEAVEMGEQSLKNGTSEEVSPYFPYETIYKKQIDVWREKL